MTSMITMFDDIDISKIPPDPEAVAGYVDGKWDNYNALVAKFPQAKHLSISVFPSDNAQCLDVETGDATIAEIYGWFTRQQAAKVWRPVVYSSVGNMDHVVATMTANKFPRASYRLWSAHYAAGQHICGPASCKLTGTAVDGTQWTSTARGESLDQSELAPDFFGAAPAKKTWREWDTAGELSLAAFAAKLDVGVATLLANTAKHFGYFNPPLGAYIKGLAEGTVAPTAPMPKGCKLWVLA